MRGKVFFFTGASFCAIFFLEPSGNLLLEPSGSSWVPPDGSIFVFAIGSPPRVRGKVPLGQGLHHSIGITPAYAGKRVHSELEGPRSEDHPRVCGEKHTHLNGTFLNLGSPPRMRGKAPLLSKAPSECGITPAYAGKSDYRCVTAQAYWDHPRVCGEKRQQHYILWSLSGSPPRMRGKVLLRSGPDAWGRITPAYAGKRHVCSAPCKGMGDHPRVCGEKGLALPLALPPQGSPPRMRGKGMYAVHPARTRGITPAYAGKRAAPAVHGSSF